MTVICKTAQYATLVFMAVNNDHLKPATRVHGVNLGLQVLLSLNLPVVKIAPVGDIQK
jgi:hypothetical protein